MPKLVRSAICLFVALVLLLMSGCGSTKTGHKNNATSPTTAPSAPAQTASQRTGPTQAPRRSKTPPRKVARATPPRKQRAAEGEPEFKVNKETAAEAEARYRRRAREREARERAAARPGLEFAEAQLPRSRRYPKELQGKFMVACKAAKGSTSTCECIVAKQELKRNIEVGQGLAELLGLELALVRTHATLQDVIRHRVPAPFAVRKVARECK